MEHTNKVKEELLNRIRLSENTNNETCNNLRDYIQTKVHNFDLIIDKFSFQVSESQKANAKERLRLEKLDELIKFKDNADEKLYSIKSKLMTLEKDVSKTIIKYDKIFIMFYHNFFLKILLILVANCLFSIFSKADAVA